MIMVQDGITVDVPAGWDAWFYQDEGRTVCHLATFPLQRQRGHSFGMDNVGVMPPQSAFMALLEFSREEVNTPLFSETRPKSVLTTDLNPKAFVSAQPGRYARQWFFTESDRAFCLYCVVADQDLTRSAAAAPTAGAILDGANRASKVLTSLAIAPRQVPLPAGP